tara:strand:+ start:187 stop:648 length:462 start_codon:yes stop_codon:yes gene_type:complete
MSGGLFGRAFVLNIKCIIFSLIIMILFLYKPTIKSKLLLGFILFGIFVISYVGLAWYDYYYDCRLLPLQRGDKSLTGLLKPVPHSQKQLDKSNTKKGNLLIYLSHIIFIVPLLLYIAYYKHKVKPFIYSILIALALFTLIYHGGAMLQGSHNL